MVFPIMYLSITVLNPCCLFKDNLYTHEIRALFLFFDCKPAFCL